MFFITKGIGIYIYSKETHLARPDLTVWGVKPQHHMPVNMMFNIYVCLSISVGKTIAYTMNIKL